MSCVRVRALNSHAWSVASWVAPVTIQFLVGALVIVLVLLGKPAFFGTQDRIWFSTATVITAVVAATMGAVFRYGAVGFAAATVTVFVGSLTAWISFPYFPFNRYFVLLILAYLVAAMILARRAGKSGQAGRGMLIGLVSIPLSPAIMWISAIAMLAE